MCHHQLRSPLRAAHFAVAFALIACSRTTTLVAAGSHAGHSGATAGAAADAAKLSGPAQCVAEGGRCVLGGSRNCVTFGEADCNPDRNPGGAFCCLQDNLACGNEGVMVINASDYDQTCRADVDCVGVGEGNACEPCVVACINASINKSAEAQYRADVARAIMSLDPLGECHCPASFTPCCMAGLCHSGQDCVKR